MSRPEDFEDEAVDGELPLDADEEARLAGALRAALQPESIDPGLHERILQRALSEPLAPATPAEREGAERLRLALEGEGDSEHLALARALRFAHSAKIPSLELAERAHARALEKAVPKRNNVIYAAFGAVSGMFALAAAVALVLTPLHKASPELRARPELARSRSLAPMLNVEATRLSPSERMDRIASAREKDLRNNRYARWGVR